MTTPASAAGDVVAGTISIRVTAPDGTCGEYEIPPGDALVVGSSPACGVRIEGAGIAPMHCTLSCEDGMLVVDDWDTGAGTYLNGQRIARQGTAEPGATVEIAGYRFETEAAGMDLSFSADDMEQQEDDEPEAYVHKDTDPFLPAFATARPGSEPQAGNKPPSPAWDEPPSQTRPPEGATAAGNACEADAYDADAYDADAFDSDADDADAYDADPYTAPVEAAPAYQSNGVVDADDMTELLKIELDYLRSELADRDQRLAELEQSLEGDATPHDADLPSREEVDALADRLEQLLAELEHSDERLKTMSELLRVSEEANVAAVEERTQTEAWMGEVERRVSDWESEWKAERDSLNRRIAELTTQRDEAEARGGSRENTALIQKLRQQISQYEAETARLQAEQQELQQRMQQADVASVEEQIQKAVDAAMREERLQLSQERAEVARERAALMKQQEELAARPLSQSSSADVADLKIRAFREHLREIRENEPDHRPAPTMSQRLGKLWRKIDGRPLDTD